MPKLDVTNDKAGTGTLGLKSGPARPSGFTTTELLLSRNCLPTWLPTGRSGRFAMQWTQRDLTSVVTADTALCDGQ